MHTQQNATYRAKDTLLGFGFYDVNKTIQVENSRKSTIKRCSITTLYDDFQLLKIYF